MGGGGRSGEEEKEEDGLGQGCEAHRKDVYVCLVACLLLIPTTSARSEGNTIRIHL